MSERGLCSTTPGRTVEGSLDMSTASRCPANARMPFPRAMRCTWEPWHRRRGRCPPAPVGNPSACGWTVSHAHSGPSALGRDVVAGFVLGAFPNRPSGFGPATRATLQRRTSMRVLQDLKGVRSAPPVCGAPASGRPRPWALRTIPKVPVPRKDPVYGAGGPLLKLWKRAK